MKSSMHHVGRCHLSSRVGFVNRQAGTVFSRGLTHVTAAGPPPPSKGRPVRDSGYFSDADPNKPVGNPLSIVTPLDITKKAGRYGPEFIWQTNWKDALDFQEDRDRQSKEAKEAGAVGAAGNLSIRRVLDLNRMDVDLSEHLRPRQPKEATQAGRGQGSGEGSMRAPRNRAYPSNPASQGEVRRWERSGKFSRRVSAPAPTEEEAAELARLAAEERVRYDELKMELQAWTLAAGALGFAATWAFYSKDTAASYLAGAAGGLLYLRALHRSVDAVGGFSLSSMASNQRLLIPIILALSYNRFNTLAAEQTGITLQLLPMLLGFFTYKAAVVAKQSLVLLGELTGSPPRPPAEVAAPAPSPPAGAPADAGGPAAAGDGGSAAAEARRREVDRLFNNRVLSG